VKLKILNQSYNPLLQRRELNVEVEHGAEGTPSRASIRKLISAQLGVEEKKVYIVNVKTLTGTNKSMCRIECYDDVSTGERIVPEHLRNRGVKQGGEASGESEKHGGDVKEVKERG
jgi:ribosomal protein S24E